MHRRQKSAHRFQDVIDQVTDPDRRRELADQASDLATRVASEVAKRSVDLGSQVGDTVSDAAQAVAAERHQLMEQHAKKAKRKEKAKRTTKASKSVKRRARRALVFAGLGAVAAYFLDPESGAERRAAARRRTSTSAQLVGSGLDRAAQVAHQTAEATAVAPEPAAERVEVSQAPLS